MVCYSFNENDAIHSRHFFALKNPFLRKGLFLTGNRRLASTNLAIGFEHCRNSVPNSLTNKINLDGKNNLWKTAKNQAAKSVNRAVEYRAEHKHHSGDTNAESQNFVLFHSRSPYNVFNLFFSSSRFLELFLSFLYFMVDVYFLLLM